MDVSKGSLWHKWDLHIHSPLSVLNNKFPKLADGQPDWDKYIEKLNSIDCAVLGITDYFTIEGYKKVKELKDQGKLQKVASIFPNIEFRLNSVLSSRHDGKDPRRLNMHVIFSDEVTSQNIEDHFLSNLVFYYEGNPQENPYGYKLKISELERAGADLIEEHKSFKESNKSALEVGAMTAVVSFDQIVEILTSDKRFKSKYLIVFPEYLFNLINWDGQDHLLRKTILQKSDAIFSSNPSTRSWSLGETPSYAEGVKAFIKEFHSLKPCIHGSDAHTLEEIGYPCIKRGEINHKCQEQDCSLRYCWIKADPTFEGLKQIIYEPKHRVAIQEKDPTMLKSNYTIDRLEISNVDIDKDLTLDKSSLKINRDLVAVIGSKGSGKTALVDLIANCYENRVSSNDDNSFVKRVNKQNPDLKIKLEFKDGDKFNKSILENKFYEDGNIVYIPQGQLEERVGKNSDLEKDINKLIFVSGKVKDTVKSYEYSNLVTLIKELDNKIRDKNLTIEELERKTDKNVEDFIRKDEKLLNAELIDVLNKIKSIENNQTKENIAIAQRKYKDLEMLKENRDKLISSKGLIRHINNFINRDLKLLNEEISQLNSLVESLKLGEKIKPFYYDDNKKILEKEKLIEKELNTVIEKLESTQSDIQKYDTQIKQHTKLLDHKKEIEKHIELSKEKTVQLEKNRTMLLDEEKERNNLLKALIENIQKQKELYKEIIKAFSSDKARVLSDLEFVAEIEFDKDKLITMAEDVIDNRRVIIDPDDKKSVFLKLIKFYDDLSSGTKIEIDDLIKEIDLLNKTYKFKLKKSSAIKLSDFYNFLYKNYFSVTPKVKYKNIEISKLSLGQKATVLIKIYLADGDAPIIIDSHDDYLDNEFIMDELVDALREAKQYRQIIIVSNNGNVVINSDSEQIILAKKTRKNISYSSGSIENRDIRDKALEILEGGQPAFKQRQLKYRI